MTSIKAECPRCGAVRLGPHDVTVRTCAADGTGAYRFRCPACATAAVHEASPAICALLRQAGCAEEVWHLPAELTERRLGPALTPDDLLDFHLLLRGDDWPERLQAVNRDT
ncbi:MAG: hypothetical protein MUP97_02375 [Acidimicrobiia bacterium]|nr:hypothetical protein [Acidimicrobiia bacterium]